VSETQADGNVRCTNTHSSAAGGGGGAESESAHGAAHVITRYSMISRRKNNVHCLKF